MRVRLSQETQWHKMLEQGEYKLHIFLTLVVATFAKLPSDASWTTFTGKAPVYSRSLGPPMAPNFNTISVPYISKSPMFPKFVDPKTMITKKTDILSNIFGSTEAANPYNNGGFPTEGSYIPKNFKGIKKPSSAESGVYKRGIFGPFGAFPGPLFPMMGYGSSGAPDFGLYGPKYPYSSTGQIFGTGSYITPNTSRRRRDIPSLPPSYPGLSTIAEEPEENIFKTPPSSKKTPIQFLASPFSPFGPMVDPSMFITKKTSFLDTMFKNIATSTTLPTSTDVPVPKSTIVPPNFWYPSSIISDPTEYSGKVSNFLDKLFDSLKLNKTTIQSNADTTKYNFARDIDSASETQKKVAKSVDDFFKITSTKDAIVDSILSELTDLKGDMISTLDDLLTFQKVSTTFSTSAKKPFKPFGTGPWSKPSIDSTLPFRQRMLLIGQVFDMLTEIQRNITSVIQEFANTKFDVTNSFAPFHTNDVFTPGSNINATLLDVIRSKLNLDSSNYYGQTFNSPFSSKVPRTVPQSATSFWVAYPQGNIGTDVKRQVEEYPFENVYDQSFKDNRHDRNQHVRAVNMQMHQGYQSMPPGTIESVQAGGGSAPGHQGGGIKLLNSKDYENVGKWSNWKEFIKNQYEESRHHHNHH